MLLISFVARSEGKGRQCMQGARIRMGCTQSVVGVMSCQPDEVVQTSTTIAVRRHLLRLVRKITRTPAKLLQERRMAGKHANIS
jgi:hypothetical protein